MSAILSIPEREITLAGPDNEAIRRLFDRFMSGGEVWPLRQSGERYPGLAAEQPTPQTWMNWATRGIQLSDGSVLRLASIRLGRHWFTDQQAIEEFIIVQTRDGLTAEAGTPPEAE